MRQRVQAIFGSQITSTLTEFGSSFWVPPALSQPSDDSSILSANSLEAAPSSVSSSSSFSLSLHANTDKGANGGISGIPEIDRIQYDFSSNCCWNQVLKERADACDLQGFVTGFVSRIGSSSNSSDRGNQNLSSRGNASKQLVFVNGRLVDYKKVGVIMLIVNK